MRILIISFAIPFLISCGSPAKYPDAVRQALENAGKNRSELEKVIKHYNKNPSDSLKLQAAYFLISNLDGLKTLDTASVTTDIYYNAIHKDNLKNIKVIYPLAKTIDSVNLKNHVVVGSPIYNDELEVVSHDFLIRNIEQAFYVWQNMPWAKHIGFDDFCEYILPYRSSDTYSTDSREFFFNKYKNLTDSLKNSKSTFEVGEMILKDIDSWFLETVDIFLKYPYLRPSKFSNLLEGRIGDCMDASSLRIAALRSLGIPVALDQLPNWGNNRNKHFWHKIIDSANDTLKSLITNKDTTLSTNHIIPASTYTENHLVVSGVPDKVMIRYSRTVPKVYRQFFSKQKQSLAFLKPANLYIPAYFMNDRLKDVTREYVECRDVTIKINKDIKKHKIVYLCVFDKSEWVPVSWAEINNNQVIFKDMGINIVYLLSCYDNDKIVPLGSPFLLNLRGQQEVLKDSGKKQTVRLYTKYPYRAMIYERQSGLIGGKFQFANKNDLSDTITAHEVSETPFYENEVSLQNPNSYRYLLYNFKNSKSWIAEMAFFTKTKTGKEQKLTGQLIGNPGHEVFSAKNMFDDNRLTFFESVSGDYYVGIDLGKNRAQKITKIRFLPRNDDNAVVSGKYYKLFYWDGRWRSLGYSIGAKDKTATFNNVPTNVILLLKNTEGGQENRIFTYNYGKQVFW